MAETPRERWTISKLDELNHGVMGKLTQLDQAARAIRADIKELVGGGYHGYKCPLISDGLTWGESWTDERIDDLRCAVSNGVMNLDGDIHELLDEIDALRLRRHCRRGLVAQRRHSSRSCGIAPRGGSWTDGRLDDFNHRVGVDFARLECDIQEIQSQVEGVRTGFRARWVAHLYLWKWALLGGIYGVAITFLLSRAAHGS